MGPDRLCAELGKVALGKKEHICEGSSGQCDDTNGRGDVGGKEDRTGGNLSLGCPIRRLNSVLVLKEPCWGGSHRRTGLSAAR